MDVEQALRAAQADALRWERKYHDLLDAAEEIRGQPDGELSKLRVPEAPMRLLLESVQDYAIFTLDAEGRVTSWNAGARRLNEGQLEPAMRAVAEIEDALRKSVQITRELSVDLSPPVLHNEGLAAAMRWLALSKADGHLRSDVIDDGRGFDPGESGDGSGSSQTGQGLPRIEQRMQLLGGSMEVASIPEQGTQVTLYVPLHGREEKNS